MANERYGLRCPICKDCRYLGKTMGDGIYINASGEPNVEAEHLDMIFKWMWKHLLECHGEFQWGSGNEVLFEIVHEGHEDVVRGIKEGKHWTRKVEDGE